jgi:hypothetical protein
MPRWRRSGACGGAAAAVGPIGLGAGANSALLHGGAPCAEVPGAAAAAGHASHVVPPVSALIRAASAGWRRSFSRQRPRLGPMLPAGMPSLALISA